MYSGIALISIPNPAPPSANYNLAIPFIRMYVRTYIYLYMYIKLNFLDKTCLRTWQRRLVNPISLSYRNIYRATTSAAVAGSILYTYLFYTYSQLIALVLRRLPA